MCGVREWLRSVKVENRWRSRTRSTGTDPTVVGSSTIIVGDGSNEVIRG